tara:strand:- start:1631 stop:1873 length:243 start_codon:yes stop_codon:yes gene_type:complete
MKRLLSITSGVVCLYLAYITGTGEILNYINFADPLNEMGFFACLTVMGGMLIFCGVAKDNKVPCSRELDMEMANESENIQ